MIGYAADLPAWEWVGYLKDLHLGLIGRPVPGSPVVADVGLLGIAQRPCAVGDTTFCIQFALPYRADAERIARNTICFHHLLNLGSTQKLSSVLSTVDNSGVGDP